MKESDGYLKINKQNITYEMIDEEVIVIHLEKGYYYSLRGVAAEIWVAISKEITEPTIVEGVLDRYENSNKEVIERSILNFILELKNEDLVVYSKGNPEKTVEYKNIFPHLSVKKSFEPPFMEKYTDLEELLLLDPVHEVDEYGWPSKLTKEQE